MGVVTGQGLAGLVRQRYGVRIGVGAVVLLHGWALGQHTYRSVIDAIASQDCRVIAPSLPGFGGTPALPGWRQ